MFLGTLRPHKTSSPRTVPDHIPRPDYADHPEGIPLSEQSVKLSSHIKVLNDEELEEMRVACKVMIKNIYILLIKRNHLQLLLIHFHCSLGIIFINGDGWTFSLIPWYPQYSSFISNIAIKILLGIDFNTFWVKS